MLEKSELESLRNKIELIKDNNDESCRYLVNTYNIYNNITNKEGHIEKNKNVHFLYKLNEIKDILPSDDATIISFDNNNNLNEYYGLIASHSNLEIVVVSNKNHKLKTTTKKLKFANFSKLNIINKTNNNNRKVIFYLNTNDIEIGSDWEINLIHNFEEILSKYNNYSIARLSNECEKIALNSIIKKDKDKNKMNLCKNKLSAKKIIKTIDFIVKLHHIKKSDVKFILNVNSKLSYTESIKVKELVTSIEILLIKNKIKRIEYIYDNLCNRIETDLSNYKYCEFKNNKCIAQRDINNKNNYPVNAYNGCCYKVEKKQECDKLKNKECTTKCISCRLFICRYLRDRGVSYEVKDNLQIRTFLNIMQKPVLVWNFFKDRETIIKELSKW